MSKSKRGLLSVAATVAFLAVVFTGCVLDGQQPTPAESVAPTHVSKNDTKAGQAGKSETEQDQIMKAFKDLVAKKTPLQELIAFADSHMEELSKSRRGALWLGLERDQQDTLKLLNHDLDQLDQSSLFDANGVQKTAGVAALPESRVKMVLKKPSDAGLKIFCAEGRYFFEIDYEGLLARYGDALGQDSAVTEYIKIRALESKHHYFEDGSLVITWQELLDRLQSYEAFIVQYPDFARAKDVKIMYHQYFETFIYGGNNTPVFAYEDGKISDDVEIVYRNMKLDDQYVISGKYFKTYFAAVQKSKYRYSEALNQVRGKLSEDLRTELGLSNQDFKEFEDK